MSFVVLRKGMSSVQCVLAAGAGGSAQMVAFAKSLTRESVVDIEGAVSFPKEPLVSTTQQVEIQVRKNYHINRAIPTLICCILVLTLYAPNMKSQLLRLFSFGG